MFLFFLACGEKTDVSEETTTQPPAQAPAEAKPESPPATEEATASTKPPPPRLKNNTEELVKKGILQPIAAEHSSQEALTVQFNTLYPNGCWTQTEATHEVTPASADKNGSITHSYTTTYEAEGRMCTMGFKPGGFKTELQLTPGSYDGIIMVDEKERTTYTVTVTQ